MTLANAKRVNHQTLENVVRNAASEFTRRTAIASLASLRESQKEWFSKWRVLETFISKLTILVHQRRHLYFSHRIVTPHKQHTPIEHPARGRLCVDSWSTLGQFQSKMTKTDRKLPLQDPDKRLPLRGGQGLWLKYKCRHQHFWYLFGCFRSFLGTKAIGSAKEEGCRDSAGGVLPERDLASTSKHTLLHDCLTCIQASRPPFPFSVVSH